MFDHEMTAEERADKVLAELEHVIDFCRQQWDNDEMVMAQHYLELAKVNIKKWRKECDI